MELVRLGWEKLEEMQEFKYFRSMVEVNEKSITKGL